MIYSNSDGGARGNPGPGAIGIIIRKEGQILMKYSGYLGTQVTNNTAEYEALIKALELAIKFGKEVTFILDSELVVKQLLGEYKVKHPNLIRLFQRTEILHDKFDKVRYLHSSRWDKFQQLADEMVNEELNKRGFRKYKYRRKR